jgi:AcrR family transcriptional regulator
MVNVVIERWTQRQVSLLDDLEALFRSEGFRHLTIGDMAMRTRSSRRTLYSLADSKEELVLVVVDRFYNRMGKDARSRAASASDVRDKIEAFLSASVDRNADISPAFLQDVEEYLPTRHLYDRHQALAVSALEDMIRISMDTGELRGGSPALIAEILDAVIKRLRDPAVLTKIGASKSEVMKAFGQFCREGIV